MREPLSLTSCTYNMNHLLEKVSPYLISSWFLKSTFCSEVGYIFTVILRLASSLEEIQAKFPPGGGGGREGNESVAIRGRKRSWQPASGLINQPLPGHMSLCLTHGVSYI
jgi:hypothetical protein